jgi:hypothetical protein
LWEKETNKEQNIKDFEIFWHNIALIVLILPYQTSKMQN